MKKGDFILIGIVLCLAAAGFLLFRLADRDPGGTLTVTVDGEVYGSYDLGEDQEISLDLERGHNRFRISQGKVTMIEADCPDKYCVAHAPITKSQELIICLPHRVVLEITSGEEAKDIDG